MPIKSKKENSTLTLEIDNGDLEKLEKCMETWQFKDYQSMLRFAISVFLVTEDKCLWMKSDGQPQKIAPAKEFLKDSGSI